MFGGSIKASSQLGVGTSFCFTARFALPAPDLMRTTSLITKSLPSPPSVMSTRILLAATSRSFQHVTAEYLAGEQWLEHNSLIYDNLEDLSRRLIGLGTGTVQGTEYQLTHINNGLHSPTSNIPSALLLNAAFNTQPPHYYDAVVLYCHGDVLGLVDAAQRAFASWRCFPVLVVVSAQMPQPLRKQLTDRGVRHLAFPLAGAKFRTCLLSLFEKPSEDQEAENSKPLRESAHQVESKSGPCNPHAQNVSRQNQNPYTDDSQSPQDNESSRTGSAGVPPPETNGLNNCLSDSPPRRAVRVLAVEDNATNMKILKKYLEKTGADFFSANDGAEALAAVTSRPCGFFDLILMDLHMPNVRTSFQSTYLTLAADGRISSHR